MTSLIKDTKNHSYSCGTRLVTEGVYFLAYVTVKWDGSDGFQPLHKTIVPFNTVTQQPTTPKSDSDFLDLSIIISTVGSVTCICTIIVLTLTCRKICLSKRNAAPTALITAPSNRSILEQTTPDVSMKNNHAAPKGSRKVVSFNQNLDYRRYQDFSMTNNLAAPKSSRKEHSCDNYPHNQG
ncbi:uncharacterized protein LOC127707397 [Mytilus californianus]|uniref:uncharacterized protein LOC127707397 n=1 Tax=Mytilus californianus TaxID=6549 RepID=UPI002245F8FD|nr:uncharacterized protein LOC127707397 [Mytilus californianus]